MRTPLVLVLFASLPMFSAAVAGQGEPLQFDFLADGGEVPDDGIAVFPLFMTTPDTPDIVHILSIELDIFGLTHDEPQDLDMYLIDPFGNMIEIMTDLGGSDPIDNVNLTFSDDVTTLPGEPITSGTYRPEGLFNGDDLGFATYVGGAGETHPAAAWLLVVIDDDAAQDAGSFESYTLRGTYVPEPVTLSLLALGALVTLRRRRR